MFELSEKLDLKLKQQAAELTTPYTVKDIPVDDIQPRVVGFEKDYILFSWNCEALQRHKTFVGLFDRQTWKPKLLFHHDKVNYIINGTVNFERTLLAFSCRETDDVYESFIAEVEPQNRLFSLNLRSTTYQKVKFLNENPKDTVKISHLLFFNHKEAIMLYHIPVHLTQKGFLMEKSTSSLAIAYQFLWSQFDDSTQRLYYVILCPQEKGCEDAVAMLNVVDFTVDAGFDYVLNFPLPMSFKMNLMYGECGYSNLGSSTVISAANFNMRVLHSTSGSLYLCYQHSNVEQMQESFDSSMSESSDAEVQGSFISYTVCCVHSAFNLHCSVISSAKEHISFVLYNDLLLVFLKGLFFHILDISYEHEPIHNILLEKDSPFFPELPDNHLEVFPKSLLYSDSPEKCFEFQLNLKKVYKMFCRMDAATRLSLVHLVLVHFKDKNQAKLLIKTACDDVTNVETSQLLKEYLLSNSYVRMWKFAESKYDLKLLPFTTQESFRGQVTRDDSGQRIVHLFYKRFSDQLIALIMKVLSKNRNSFWCAISSNLSYENERQRNKRFPLKLLFLAGVDMKVGRNVYRSSQAFQPDSLNYHPYEKLHNDLMAEITSDKMLKFISSSGKEVSKSVSRFCRIYASARSNTMNSLWKHLWRSYGKCLHSKVISLKLCTRASHEHLVIFQIIERLKVITDELCFPVISDMNDLFCTLGFRCLTRYQFLQYVKACVFEINAKFVSRLVVEINDTDSENVDLKMALIQKLPVPDAIKVLKSWNNTTGNRYLSQYTLAKLPSELMHLRSDLSDNCGNGTCVRFTPVNTLLESIRKQSENGKVQIQDDLLSVVRNTMIIDTETLISSSKFVDSES